jgi:hypothetical protein
MALKMPALDSLFGAVRARKRPARGSTRWIGITALQTAFLGGRAPKRPLSRVGAELCLVAELMYSLQTLLALRRRHVRRPSGGNRLQRLAGDVYRDLCAHQYVQQVNQVEVSRKKRSGTTRIRKRTSTASTQLRLLRGEHAPGWPKLLGALWMTRSGRRRRGVYAPCSANVT